jgi:chromate reductase
MHDPFRILVFAGSLRRASYNRGMVRAAVEEAPAGSVVVTHDLIDIPVGEADAVLISTPEYNHGIPGVLKNAIDWASRGEPRVLRDKPIALCGVSNGARATARSQFMTRPILLDLGMLVLPPPELLVGPAADHFDADSNLTDPVVRKRLREMLERLMAWARRLA